MRRTEFFRAAESFTLMFNSFFGGMFPQAVIGQMHDQIEEPASNALTVDPLTTINSKHWSPEVARRPSVHKSQVETCPVLSASNFQIETVFQPEQTANGIMITTPTPTYGFKDYFLRPSTKEITPPNCVYEVVTHHRDGNGDFVVVTFVNIESVVDMSNTNLGVLGKKSSQGDLIPVSTGSFLIDSNIRKTENFDRQQNLKAAPSQLILPMSGGGNADEIAYPRPDMQIGGTRDLSGLLRVLEKNIVKENGKFSLFKTVKKMPNIQFQRIDMYEVPTIDRRAEPILASELPSPTPTVTASPLPEATYTVAPTLDTAATISPEEALIGQDIIRIPVANTSAVHLKFNLPSGESVQAIETNQLGIFPALFPALLSGEVSNDQELALDDIFGRIKDIEASTEFHLFKRTVKQGKKVELSNLPGKPIDQIVLFSKESDQGGFTVVTYDPTDYIVPGQRYPKLYIYQLKAGWWWTSGPADFAEFEAFDAQGNLIPTTTRTLNDQLQWDIEDPAGPKNVTYIMPSEFVTTLQQQITKKTHFEDKLSAIHDSQKTIRISIVDNNGQLREIDVPTTLQLKDRGFKENPGDINIHGVIYLNMGLPGYIDQEVADKFKQDLISIFGSMPSSIRVLLPSSSTFVIPRDDEPKIIITSPPVQSPTPTPASYLMPNPRTKDTALQAFASTPPFELTKDRHQHLKQHNRNVMHGRI